MNKTPFTAEYELLNAAIAPLKTNNIWVSIDDGVEDDTPDIFTIEIEGIEEGEEAATLERFEEAIKEAGFRICAAEQSEQIGKAWILAGVPFGEKLSTEKEDEIRDTVRVNRGKSVEDIGGEAGVCGSWSWIKVCGELFTQDREPQADNLGDGVAWIADFKSQNYCDGGIPIALKVAYLPTTEFLNSSDEEREFLVANAEQCDWDNPVII